MTDFFLRGEGLFLPPEILVRHRDTVHSPGGSVRRDVAVLSPMLGVHALGNGTLSAPWQTVHWSRGDDSPPRLRLEFKPPEDSLPRNAKAAAAQPFTMNRFSVAASLAALSVRRQGVFAG